MLWVEPNDVAGAKVFSKLYSKIPVVELGTTTTTCSCSGSSLDQFHLWSMCELGSCIVVLEQATCWFTKGYNAHVLCLPNFIFSGVILVAKVGVFTP